MQEDLFSISLKRWNSLNDPIKPQKLTDVLVCRKLSAALFGASMCLSYRKLWFCTTYDHETELSKKELSGKIVCHLKSK